MANLTIHNTGCGLGDMLIRIDSIYKYSQKYHHIFYLPSISSNLHNQSYDEILGLKSIKPLAEEWGGEVLTLDMESLDEEIKKIANDKLIMVKFNHRFNRQFIENHNLDLLNGFNYEPYLNIKNNLQKTIDFLIHLRLGDNYIYKLQNGRYLDSGRRRILENTNSIEDEWQNQWTIDKVVSIINLLEKNKLTYRIHCDGVESGLRHVRWSSDEAYLSQKEQLISAIKDFEDSFIQKIMNRSSCVYFGNIDIKKPISDLFNSRTLVYTTGGFMSNVNKLLNSQPAKSIHFSKLLANLKS